MVFKHNYIKNCKRSANYKLKRSIISSNHYVFYNYKEYLVYVPPSWSSLVIFSKSQNATIFYLASDTYYVRFAMKSSYSNFYFNNWSNVFLFKLLYANYCYSSFFSLFQACAKLFYSPSFKKLKFKGKGYYLYKGDRNTIAPQFGYSHRLYVYSYFTHLKFLGKTTVLFFGFSMHDLLSASLRLKSLRTINIFTSRGVRFARQLLYKKQGKVSSYR